MPLSPEADPLRRAPPDRSGYSKPERNPFGHAMTVLHGPLIASVFPGL